MVSKGPVYRKIPNRIPISIWIPDTPDMKYYKMFYAMSLNSQVGSPL